MIGLVKSVPKVAVETVRAFNGIKGDSMDDGPPRDTPKLDMLIDPALLPAEVMEAQLGILNDLLQADVTTILQNGGNEFVFCLNQLKSLKQSVGNFPSKHAVKAQQFLNGSIALIEAIRATMPENPKTDQLMPGHFPGPNSTGSETPVVSLPDGKVAFWQRTLEAHLVEATKLRAYAASQPGYGFGSTMDIPQAAKGSSADNTGYNRVLKGRYEKIMIMRAAAQDAKENMTRTLNMQLAAQAKVIELNHAMKSLEHKNATIAETKVILKKSINAMRAMQEEVRQLAQIFN